MDVKHDQLEAALRKNQGEQIRDNWLKKISDACDVNIGLNELLNIKETEGIKKRFFDKVKIMSQINCLEWPRDSFKEVILYLNKIILSNICMEVILFSSVDRYIGALRLPLKYLLNNIEKIWGVVEDDLSVASIDLEHGVCLELNFYRCDGIYIKDGIYQLTAWGVFQDHISSDIQ